MPPPNTEPCPRCQQPVGTHTVDELSSHLSDLHDHHNEFAETPETQQQIQGVRAGSIAVRAGVQQTSIGAFPVLVFDFAGPDGVVPPIMLLLDDSAMRNVRHLIGTAIDAAIKHARRAR